MPALITAAFSSPLPDGIPAEIVYLPEGEHRITPFVDGKAKAITVKVPAGKGAEIAASLQSGLEKRQAGNVRAWFDFEHKSGKASALPTSFRYEPGKGIMASIEWTGAGRKAIEGKDFSYLSPTFLIDDHGFPSGLPERGPLAALVNEPAFRDIPRIAASDGSNPPPNTTATMSLILAHLGIDTAAEGAENAAVAKIQATEKELASVKAANAELVEASKAATKARHTSLVEAAVTAGKIAPKDDETKTQALELLEANEALGTKFLSALAVTHPSLDQPLVTATDGKPLHGEARIEAAQAKARHELGASAGFSLIWARAAEIDPAAFEA